MGRRCRAPTDPRGQPPRRVPRAGVDVRRDRQELDVLARRRRARQSLRAGAQPRLQPQRRAHEAGLRRPRRPARDRWLMTPRRVSRQDGSISGCLGRRGVRFMIFPAQRPRGLRRRRRGFGAAQRPVPQLMQRRSGGAPARLPSAHRRAIDGCQAAGRAEPSRAAHGPRRAKIGLVCIRVHSEIKSAVPSYSYSTE